MLGQLLTYKDKECEDNMPAGVLEISLEIFKVHVKSA